MARRTCATVFAGTAAMSFEEIAARLGMTKRAVDATYVRAMHKLRRRPALLVELCRLADELDRNRRSPTDFYEDAD